MEGEEEIINAAWTRRGKKHSLRANRRSPDVPLIYERCELQRNYYHGPSGEQKKKKKTRKRKKKEKKEEEGFCASQRINRQRVTNVINLSGQQRFV